MTRSFVRLVVVAMSLVAASSASAIGDPAAVHPGPSGPFRVEAPPGSSVLVHGTYPKVTRNCRGPVQQPLLHARYRGTIEVHRSSDGSLYLIGELPFEDYLRGIAEVPRDWPMDALRAQVVAARTYALAHLDPGGEYDLCATAECQVYVGMQVESGPWGERWVRAVQDTAHEVLRFHGKPATTFYFSTSNGRTYDNEDVFGGGPLPYLRGRPERDDGASPLSRWRVELPFGDLARFLDAAGHWRGGRVRDVRQDGGDVVIVGRRRVTLNREELRDTLNTHAPCLAPDRYPPADTGGFRLPQTIPSRWYRANREGESLVVSGRGWGHGVGMVQWGAYGKARRGLVYRDILAAYYGGLRPEAGRDPGTIRILVATGLSSLVLAPSGETVTTGGGGELQGGPWKVTGGRRLRVVDGGTPPAVLRVLEFTADHRGRADRPLPASVRLSSPARVRLDVIRAGRTIASTGWEPFDEGLARLHPRLPSLGRGRYRVRAFVTDGVDFVRTRSLPLRVRGVRHSQSLTPSPTHSPTRSPTPSASPTPESPVAAAPRSRPQGSSLPLAVAAALLAVVLAAFLLTARGRTGFHRR